MNTIQTRTTQAEVIAEIIFFAEQEFGDVYTIGETDSPNTLNILAGDTEEIVATITVREDLSIFEAHVEDGREITHVNLEALVSAWLPE